MPSATRSTRFHAVMRLLALPSLMCLTACVNSKPPPAPELIACPLPPALAAPCAPTPAVPEPPVTDTRTARHILDLHQSIAACRASKAGLVDYIETACAGE
ncbi:MAG: hypothetical protein Alpg2KO_00710 [Alphaproteobacteria bacterium]